MIRFPLFERLEVQDFGLYPGEAGDGLKVIFNPGLTLVLGANGLGKSTLVSILFRMCTGDADLSGAGSGDEFGGRQLEVRKLSPTERRTFARRVDNQAEGSTATVTVRFGLRSVTVVRRLRDLRLVALGVDGSPLQNISEDSFRDVILAQAGLTSFADWILILRYVVFYLEDRTSLVWDPTAQRQILRLLFLPPVEAARWIELETEVLKLDSRFRNIRAIVSREEKALVDVESAKASMPDTRAELERLSREQELESEELDRARRSLLATSSSRQSLRLEVLRAGENRELLFREVEQRRVAELQRSFPGYSETAAYILTQLLSTNKCLVCGNDVPHFASELATRIRQGECIVCDSSVPEVLDSFTPKLSDIQVRAEAAEKRYGALERAEAEAEAAYRHAAAVVADLEARLEARSTRIEVLTASLPPAERSVVERRSSFLGMKAHQIQLREELTTLRRVYEHFVEEQTARIASRRDEVKDEFAVYAHDFLIESCVLNSTKGKVAIGQADEPLPSFTYEIVMTGTNFAEAQRRAGPEEVSESQREFIDLAFRMALIAVAGASGVGSLVIDAPESSLDAVFAPRAADVLAQFAERSGGNRLIVTSNLVEGKLIPKLLRRAGITSLNDPRIVNLFQHAMPTAAIRRYRADYDEALAGLVNSSEAVDHAPKG